MNVNKVLLIGNLTRDPEMRSLPSGQPVANFGIATNRVWRDKEGQKQQQADFHNVVAFGKLAETVQFGPRPGGGQSGNYSQGSGSSAPRQTQQPQQQEDLATVEYPEDDVNPNEIPF